jgi:hypothetical protein
MDLVLIAAIRLLFGLVFLLAGIATLVRFSHSRRDMECFGAPARLAAPLAILLGFVELCVAVALLPLSDDSADLARPLGIFGLVIGGVIASAFFVVGFRAHTEPLVTPPLALVPNRRRKPSARPNQAA